MREFKRIFCIMLALMLLASFAGCAKVQDSEDILEGLLPQGNPLRAGVSVRAGEAVPAVDAFLNEGYSGSFVTDVSAIDTSAAGRYEIVISVDGRECTALLTVTDSTPPMGETQPVQVKPNAALTAEDFFAKMEDDGAVTAEFVTHPSTALAGQYDVALRLVDLAGNTAEFRELLIVSELEPLTLEAQADAFDAEQLFPGRDVEITEAVASNVVGTNVLRATVDGADCYTLVTVKDTVPPTGEGVQAQHYLNDPLDASRLVKNESDATELIYTYQIEPDFTKEGTQDVTVILTDGGGNTTAVQSTLTLLPDTEPPKIYGLQDHVYFYQGGPISYLATVYAEDNATASENITIDVDKSAVDIYTLGEYEVTYIATDANGNKAEKTVIVELIESTVSQAELDAKVAEVLAEITTEDMTLGEKAYAIYNYIRDNMVYINHSNKTDYVGEAYNGLVKLRGDCFTFYASTDALLRGVGAQTMKVSRKYNTTRPTNHYWLKVNLGTGWYHMDTCNTGPRNYEAFMRTDQEFTTRARTFWMFDSSLYPASPTTPYQKDW